MIVQRAFRARCGGASRLKTPGPAPQNQGVVLPEGGFVPARLTLARELLELSQAQLARRSGLSAAAVGQFEAGVTTPTTATVEALAGALKTPTGFFSVAAADVQHEGFFRSLRKTSVSHRKRARAMARIAHDIAAAVPLPAADVPAVPVVDLAATPEEIEAVAAAVRHEWQLPPGPVSNVVQLLEAHRVVVIRMPMDTADVDAFSLPFADRPVIALGNEKGDRARSRFDAAHELAHLVMHSDQIWGLKEVENQAHWFAAAFLMPADAIRNRLPRSLDWAAYFALKQEWQVSLAALLKRAHTLGRLSDQQYVAAMKATSARGWRRVEPVPLGPPEQPEQFVNAVCSEATRHLRSTLPPQVLAAFA